MSATNQKESFGVAVCKSEPRGDHGLEGYQAGDIYFFCKVTPKEEDKKSHYRVFPTLDMNNYETCSTVAFRRHFSKQSNKN